MKNTQIDLNNLEGIWFLTQYFLSYDEAKTFISMMRTLLARKAHNYLRNQIDILTKTRTISMKERIEYDRVFNMKGGEQVGDQDVSKHHNRKLNTNVFIEKNNPIFSTSMCYAQGNPVIIKTSTSEGKKVFAMYKKMKDNYSVNIKEIDKIIGKIVKRDNKSYELRDITKTDLDIIIEDLKIRAKVFYFQSLYDFQTMLSFAMRSKEQLGFFGRT
jgi:hypothetical protein